MSPILTHPADRIPDPKKSERYRQAALEERQRWQRDVLTEQEDVNGGDEGQTRKTREDEGEEDDPDPGFGDQDVQIGSVHEEDHGEEFSLLSRAKDEPPSATRRRSSSYTATPAQQLYPTLSSSSLSTPTKTQQSLLRQSLTLALQAFPSLLLSLLGLIFSGQLVDHLARWEVFERVDELFILVPILGNLKGNLEMCLGASLGTAANQGLLDTPRLRSRHLPTSLLSLLSLALPISALASLTAFLLGLLTTHTVFPPSGGEELGYTKPGIRELGFVVLTGMATAGLAGGVLGSAMSALVVGCRWGKVDPDNIASPIAACLGDLLTIFILALLGTLILPFLRSPILYVLVLGISILAAWLVWLVRQHENREKERLARTRVKRDEGLKEGGWIPLILAMVISSATGLILDQSVGKYKGYALYAISMTGLSGSVGAIHASRLSTALHATQSPRHARSSSIALHARTPSFSFASRTPKSAPRKLTSLQSALTLLLVSMPVQGFFLAFVGVSGWERVGWELAVCSIVCYVGTVAVSLWLAQLITIFCWHQKLDPDSYTLPIHSSVVDLIGQMFLVVAFEVAASMGGDVKRISRAVEG